MEEGDYCGCYCLLKGHYAKCYRPTVRSLWSQSTAETLSVCVCVYEFDKTKVLRDIKMCVNARAGGTRVFPNHSVSFLISACLPEPQPHFLHQSAMPLATTRLHTYCLV